LLDSIVLRLYEGLWRLPGYPVNASVGMLEIDPRGVLAAYETKMLNDDAKVESLAMETHHYCCWWFAS
jgi:hypothetical protein